MLWSMVCSAFSNFTVIAMLQDEETEAQRNCVPGSDSGKGRARVGIQDWWIAKPTPFVLQYTTRLLEKRWRPRLVSLRLPTAD